jgi:hypothetical protein
MTLKNKSTVAGVGLLLVFGQICLSASQQDEVFEKIWSAYGQKADLELMALPAKGRAAFQKALIACSIYADAYPNLKYTSECETTSSYFLTEFSDNSSALSVLFKAAMTLTGAYDTQTKFEFAQGRGQLSDDDLRKVYMQVILKAYRDTIPVR